MKRIPVVLFGVGGVGRALIEQIVAARETHLARANCRFDVVAVVDSQSWRWEPRGLDDETLTALVRAKVQARRANAAKQGAKGREEPLLGEAHPGNEAIVQQAIDAGLETGILVDVTASDEMRGAIDAALQAGYGVALANKKPLAGRWETAQRYFDKPQIRYEATVGGGQPVIATLRYLLDSGDRLAQVSGQLSGTLSYILQRMDDGKTSFSVALAAARISGITEPDPRQDLGGRDVQRKLLILGRTAGWALEEEAIAVESLYSRSLAHLDVHEFMLAAVAMDPSLQERVNAAGASGEVLRYLAEVGPDGGQVGLKAVPADSAEANLKFVSFRTGRYAEHPLLVGSNSGGVQTTAAAVLGDMVSLSREW